MILFYYYLSCLMVFFTPFIVIWCMTASYFFYYYDKFTLLRVYRIDIKYSLALMRYLIRTYFFVLKYHIQKDQHHHDARPHLHVRRNLSTKTNRGILPHRHRCYGHLRHHLWRMLHVHLHIRGKYDC